MPVGKSSKDIFSSAKSKPTPARAKAKSKPTPPAPPKKHSEPYDKTTVVLMRRQVAFLDHLCADVKATTGATLKRAEVIRGLIDALEAAGIPPENLTSEEAVRKLATARMKGK